MFPVLAAAERGIHDDTTAATYGCGRPTAELGVDALIPWVAVMCGWGAV